MPSPFCVSAHNSAAPPTPRTLVAAFLSEWVYMGEGSAAFPFCASAHNPAAPTHSSHPSAVSVVSQRTRITAISFVYARTISHDYSQFSSVRRENKLVR